MLINSQVVLVLVTWYWCRSWSLQAIMLQRVFSSQKEETQLLLNADSHVIIDLLSQITVDLCRLLVEWTTALQMHSNNIVDLLLAETHHKS